MAHASRDEVRHVRLRATQLASDFGERKELAAPVRGAIDWRWHPPLQRRNSRRNSAKRTFESTGPFPRVALPGNRIKPEPLRERLIRSSPPVVSFRFPLVDSGVAATVYVGDHVDVEGYVGTVVIR